MIVTRYRYWHISNPPNSPFYSEALETENLEEEIPYILDRLKTLADYDIYLGDLIEANAQGLEVYDPVSGEWEEWEDRNGYTIGEQG
jgi:hypothetical protein